MTRWWHVSREPTEGQATLGALYLDGRWLSWSLEDTIRERAGEPVDQWKVKGQTAIPVGRYRVRLTWSPKFKRNLPELLDVPGFAGIRIHAGNRPEDTEGCLLVGFRRAGCAILDSRLAEAEVCTRLKAAEEAGDDVWIVILNPPTFSLG